MKEFLANPSNSTVDEEAALVGRCVKGDQAALELLVRSHLRMVFSVTCRFSDHLTEAEDLCQEVFVKVVGGLPGFRGESKLRTWIYSAAVAHCIDSRRKRRVACLPIEQSRAARTAVAREEGPEKHTLRNERAMAVHRAVQSLPPDLKNVVVMYEFEGLSQKEIAALTRLPEGTVWSRLHKARSLLREKLSCLI